LLDPEAFGKLLVLSPFGVYNIGAFTSYFMVHRMQKLAKELDIVIPVSFFEEANNAHYNSVAIIDADGTDLGLYRKSHIPDGPGMTLWLSLPVPI
jgi:predicted amidohydrolase